MPKSDKRHLIVLLVLSGLALFPLAKPSASLMDGRLDPRFQAVPFKIGNWTGKNVAVDELTYQILETKNVLSRLYRNERGETVHLLLVGSERDRRVAHPPEVCYISSHYDVVNSQESTVQISGQEIPVKSFVAQDQKNPNDKEQVLYLYQVGKRFTTNYYAQQLRFALDRMTRQDSRVLLIRLAGGRREQLEEFLAQILAHIS